MAVTIWHGEMQDVLENEFGPSEFGALVTDPPYGYQFQANNATEWDHVPVIKQWEQVYRVLKPGAYGTVFSGPRVMHYTMLELEKAGFEIRDVLLWLYGEGFVKQNDISRNIDLLHGIKRSGSGVANLENDGSISVAEPVTEDAKIWNGWGTQLRPAWNPIILIRKPMGNRSAANNLLDWGTGALNVAGCGEKIKKRKLKKTPTEQGDGSVWYGAETLNSGRYLGHVREWKFPANVLHDGTFPEGIAKYFYCPITKGRGRDAGNHPTVKPVDLMRWLVRLVTPENETVLDPFGGSGTTGIASTRERRDCVLIEMLERYAMVARKRNRKETKVLRFRKAGEYE